jgi:serine/threonine protein kinase/tetratricopeptide (TPR) repeat protein
MSSQTATEFTGTDRFRLVRRIGAGGMGIVFEAEDRERGTHVALKTLPGVEAGSLYRFKREFRALADVSHPNLVTLYELHSVGPHWFFTMELVDGIDFVSFVRGSSPSPRLHGTQSRFDTDDAVIDDTTDLPLVVLPAPGDPVARGNDMTSLPRPTPAAPPPAADIARLRGALTQLAAGVAALHAAGKLHRDLKPGNILVRPEGRVVILDFGLAADIGESLTEHRTEMLAAGTVSYMAPEQAAGRALTAAADWYAVGTILYKALTGRLPFTGNALQILAAKQSTPAPAPRMLAPDAPADLDRLCSDLLATRPEDRPDGAAILERLGADAAAPPLTAAPAAPSGPRGSLVGRQQHLDTLAGAFAETRQGQAVTIYVHGRSGVGKSFLVQRFLEDVHREGAVVLAGRCFEQESVPYKALDSLIDALTRYLRRLPREEAAVLLPRDVMALARVFPVLRRVEVVNESTFRARATPDPQELRRRAFGALRELLARLGDCRPLVLAIDDLQWGDLDSAALLRDLLRPPDPPQLLLVGSYRSEHAAASPCLTALLESGGEDPAPRVIAVEPLDTAEAAALAAELLEVPADPPDIRAEQIARESGGVPFFIQELVQHVRSGADVGPAAGATAVARISLDDILWSRSRRLAPAARRLLEVVAVAGRPLRQADAYRAAGLSGDVSQALQEVRVGHFVRSTGPGALDQIDSYHDRVREIVVQRLAPAERSDYHRSLALTLEASGHGDPETLAVHFERSGAREQAGHYAAVAAAAAAEALAFDRAATLFRSALDLQAPHGERTRELRVLLADALANAGRCLEAAREYEQAAVGASERQFLDLQRHAAFHYTISGHAAEGREAFRQVLGVMGIAPPSTPRRALLHFLFSRARLRLRGLSFTPRDAGDIAAADLLRIDTLRSVAVGLSMFAPVIGRDFQTRSTIDSLRAGEPGRIALALSWEAVHSACDGVPSHRQTQRYLNTARQVADRTAQPHPLGMAAMAQGGVAFLEGRFLEGVRWSDDAERILRERCTGVTWELDTAHNFALWSLLFAGDLTALNGRYTTLFQEARARGDLYAEATLGTYIATLALLPSGETEEARDQIRQVMSRWPGEGYTIQQLDADYGEFYADLYAGRGAEAWARVAPMWRRSDESMVLRVQLCRIESLSLSARAALSAAGQAVDPRPFVAAAADYARRLRRERAAWATPLADFAHAGVAALRGDRAGAVAALDRGVRGAEETDLSAFAAAGRWRLAELVGGDTGLEHRRRADAWMSAHAVRCPERVVECFVPGFAPR